MSASATPTPILGLWSQTDAEKESAALTLSVKRLKANADAYMVEAAQEKLNAEAALEKSLQASKKSPNFGSIVKAKLRAAAADLTYAKGAEVYERYFGVAPAV